MKPKVRKTASKPRGARRRPHNAAKPRSFQSVDELTCSIGAEPRSATIGGKKVVMAQAMRLCCITVDSALKGSVSDLRLIIRTMVDHPEIVGSARERWVLFLAGSDAQL